MYTNPANNVTAEDNTKDLGRSDVRWDDIHATNGTIQTSDENEKVNIASLTSAEITATAISSRLFKIFKWKDKVAAKGDNARTHTGVIAQQVQTAMSLHLLHQETMLSGVLQTWWESNVTGYCCKANEAKMD